MWLKNRCLDDSNAESAAALAFLLSVPFSPLIFRASRAAYRFWWMI